MIKSDEKKHLFSWSPRSFVFKESSQEHIWRIIIERLPEIKKKVTVWEILSHLWEIVTKNSIHVTVFYLKSIFTIFLWWTFKCDSFLLCEIEIFGILPHNFQILLKAIKGFKWTDWQPCPLPSEYGLPGWDEVTHGVKPRDEGLALPHGSRSNTHASECKRTLFTGTGSSEECSHSAQGQRKSVRIMQSCWKKKCIDATAKKLAALGSTVQLRHNESLGSAKLSCKISISSCFVSSRH